MHDYEDIETSFRQSSVWNVGSASYALGPPFPREHPQPAPNENDTLTKTYTELTSSATAPGNNFAETSTWHGFMVVRSS